MINSVSYNNPSQLLPEIIDSQIERQQALHLSATFQCKVPSCLKWFNGHFEGFQILPGVAQLDWVMHLLHECGVSDQFTGFERLKFSRPIRPDEELQIRLMVSPDFAKFFILNDDGEFASGRVMFLS
ncbi:hypothetical protein [Marinibactrum halimedae]|uniref:Thioester dehydrase n=1 Tax=Marinibactrum halimedae TaxID=1444977 RepID=A0AA37T9U5_9GAMM|nr:hypothetical protein [Marinibactrum halimedae]MCD9460436.1 hypothetical protein [Marinibactrum halimedae]GLS27433.1 thioester dehydrase [Marinibactrum halimedae]